MTAGPVLIATAISKRFGGVQALDAVSLDVRPGEILGLVGANGAGKSTLIGVLSGAVKPDTGSIVVKGTAVPPGDLHGARRAGIAVVHQELMLFHDRTVEENVAAGRLPRHPLAIVDRRLRRRMVAETLASLGADIPLDRRVRDLPLAQQQIVEIGRALHGGGSLLVLDEPTSALSRPDTVGLFSTLRALVADGTSVIFVSHKLDEVFELSDRITVMRDGRVAGTWEADAVDLRTITRAMVGELAEASRHSATSKGAVLVSLVGAMGRDVGPLDLDLRAGEVVGLCGLEGSGTTEVLELMAGVSPSDAPFTIEGAQRHPRSPADAIALGLVYLPPDRKRQGLWLERSPLWNVSAAEVGRIRALDLLPSRKLRDSANRQLDGVGVRAVDRDQLVSRFSGGNQQRVMLARCLEMHPKVLLLSDFTRGVDVRAKAAIHEIVRRLAASGMSICLTSSDMDELLEVCDRLVFMRGGRKIAEGDAASFDRMDVVSLVTTGRRSPQSTQSDAGSAG